MLRAPHLASETSSLLEPFVATSATPWDRECAAHFARRAGFGAAPDDVERLLAAGFPKAVDEWIDADGEEPELELAMQKKGGPLTELDNHSRLGERLGDHVRMWWLFRMASAQKPLHERLALLWHDHFACRESELLSPELLLAQNRLFRSKGAGSFGELLRAVARDPAMLVFLDNRSNEKSRPNENWARELCELFTLGVDHYTQRDIVEIARAFTGWGITKDQEPRFVFRPERHDTGDKLIFGRVLIGRSGEQGVEEGHDVLDLLLARDECTRRIASKLATWFIADEPSDAWIRELARELRSNRFSIRETLRKLFRSRAFYADDVRLALTRTPVDFAVAAVRALGVQNPHLAGLETSTARMGMQLLGPPSVAGWKLGANWIHAAAAVQRSQLAAHLANLPHTVHEVDGRAALDFDRLAEGRTEARAIAEVLARRFLPDEVAPAALDELVARIERDPDHSPRRAVRLSIAAWISAPEFSLA